MKISFNDNEFTRTNILDYLRKAYGRMLNGNRFSVYHLNNWARIGKLPGVYGGHRILKVEKVPIGRGIKIYTLEGVTRDILTEIDLLSNRFPKANKKSDKRCHARKHRTQYYYDILGKAGKQYTRKTLKAATLPDNYKEIGIKQNQLARRRYKIIAK